MELHVGPDGYVELAQALAHANLGDVIVLDAAYLASEPPVLVDRAVTIRSERGQVGVPPLVVEATGAVVLDGLRFSRTDDSLSPCALGAALFDVDALIDGAALCVLGGDVAVVDSAFVGTSGIGAIVVGADATFTTTSFSGWTGGAVWAVGASLEVADSSFLSGRAALGAGVFAVGSEIMVRGTSFSGLHAEQDGGALALVDTYAEIVDVVFDDVSAGRDGGALWAAGSEPFDVVLASTAFVGSGQPAARRGGGLALHGGRLLATDVTFTNLAALDGGAVFASSAVVDATRVALCGNAAERGGALALADASLTLRNGRSIGNHAALGASVLAAGAGAVDVSQTTFVDDDGGSVLDASGPSVLLRGSILSSGSPSIRLASGSTARGDHDLWWRGSIAVGEVVGLELPSPTDVTADPRFADYGGAADCDAGLWLLPDSPALDAGDPEARDADGSATDIGAYGGPDAVLPDLDRDGFAWGVDCDDDDASVHPEASDAPLDGVDQDCDGFDACDADGDGVCAPFDCDDSASDVWPGALERPYDGVDQDCSGADACDLDGDGSLDPRCGGDDCDDADPAACPRGGYFSGGCATVPGADAFVGGILGSLLLRRRARRSALG